MPVYPKSQVQINVQDFLSNPTRITRQLDRLINETGTIADYAFTGGPANQGAVIYDQILSDSLTPERDVEVIAPGSEFPEVVDVQVTEQVARVEKYGGKVELTWEALRRNDVGEVQRKLNLLAYLVTKRINAVAVSSIANNANILTMAVGAVWSDTVNSDPIGDIFTAKGMIDNSDLGYRANLALVNPLDMTQFFFGRKDVRSQFAREGNMNPILAADLGRMAGLEWISTNRVPQGTLYMLQRGMSGSLRDEEGGLQVNTYDNQDRQVRILQSWRTVVPIITDPKSIVKVTGIRA